MTTKVKEMQEYTTEELRALTQSELEAMSNADVRFVWSYGRNCDASDRAHLVLRGRDQCGPDDKPYVWGTIVQKHVLGPYTIVESVRDEPYHGKHPVTGEYGRVMPEDDTAPRFHPYIGEHDLGRSYGDLERAVVAAIAYKHIAEAEGRNTAANEYPERYFFRMIDGGRKDGDD